MFSEKFLEVIGKEGVVSIVSCDESGPHVVNTWNTYLVTKNGDTLMIPAYAMRKTEKKTTHSCFRSLTKRSGSNERGSLGIHSYSFNLTVIFNPSLIAPLLFCK